MPPSNKHQRYNTSLKGKARVVRYESTAKAMLRKARYDAKRRSS